MAPKDRLGDFLAKKARSSSRSFGFQRQRAGTESPDGNGKRITMSSNFSEKFLSKVEIINQGIELLRKTVSQIRTIQLSIMSSPLLEDGYHQELDQALMEFRRIAQDIRHDLQALENDIAFAKRSENTINFRIFSTQRAALTKKLNEVLVEYGKNHAEYRTKCQTRLQRQLEIVGKPALNQDELNNILDHGANSVFTQGIIAESQSAKMALRDIEARHEELLSLEKSIREVRDLFVDLSLLVESQGETIDNIEVNIELARDQVSSAGSILQEARAMKRTARRRKTKLIIFLTLAVIIIVTIVVVGIYFGI